jgi:hypothetical protein
MSAVVTLRPKLPRAADDGQLIANGYEPVPVVGKRPVGTGWPSRPNTIEAIAQERAETPTALSTGLRTGRLVGIDIDVKPEEHVAALREVIAEVLGDTPLIRLGAKGAMLCYRNEAPIGKITVATDGHERSDADAANRKPAKVEVLGTGQQFVAYGIHPVINKPYRWVAQEIADDDDGDIGAIFDPLTYELGRLPEVTPEKLRQCAEQIAAKLAELGYRNARLTGGSESTARDGDALEGKPVAKDELLARLALIDPDSGRDEWRNIVAAIRATPLRDVPPEEWKETQLDIALRWSRGEYDLEGRWTDGTTPDSYTDDDDVEQVFWSMPPKAGGVSFGTIDARARQNGFDGPPPRQLPSEVFQEYAKRVLDQPTTMDQCLPQQRRFQARLPSEDADLPQLTYYDTEQTMPCLPDGGVLVVTGKTQSHKTGLVMKKCLDAIERTGAKVLYVAAEGAHGIRTIRLPLYRRERNMAWEILDARWRTLSEGFNLFDPTDREALIQDFSDLRPDVVVFDTLTRVIPGQDINTPATGAGINTCADEIARAWNALVILIHHPGKNQEKGSMGSALIESLAYAVWHVSKEAESDTVRCWVNKMKDGRAEFDVRYGIGWTAPGNVPCVRDRTSGERQRQCDTFRRDVLAALAGCPDGQASTQELAERLVTANGADRSRHVENMVRTLQRAIGTKDKPGKLSDLIERDRYGEFMKPYIFRCPREGDQLDDTALRGDPATYPRH